MDLEKISSLKWLSRTGWMLRGIPNAVAESVASHSFEVALISLELASLCRKEGVSLNLEKVLIMALLHDVPEAVTGDIVKWSKVRINDEGRLETEALHELQMDGYVGLIKEFKEGRTIESQIVKISDHVSTMLQAARYYRQGFRDVEDIVKGSSSSIDLLLHKEPVADCAAIIKERLSEWMKTSTHI